VAQDVDKHRPHHGDDRLQAAASAPPEGVKVVTPRRTRLSPASIANLDGTITFEEIEIAAGSARRSTIADRNGDGLITGFEQTDWAASWATPPAMCSPTP
jgi:hypothetical protein